MGEGKIQQMNMFTTVVALVNGMIGGSILVIPLASMQAGWAYTIIIILFTGVFSFYSCYLAVIHMGDQKDLDSAILRHFNGSRFLKLFYDFCVWLGLILLLFLYFQLIIIQWEGLVPPYTFTYANAVINGVVMVFWCLLLKYFQFGAHMMAYGIISIFAYLIFLIWVLATDQPGPTTVPAFGTGVAGFASMMGNAFSIQGFFIPVLKSCPKESKHVWLLFLAYVAGTLAYFYIAFMGSFGILGRTNYQNSGTIQQFFTNGQWEVNLLQGIYLIHLYSVFPEYLIVCKKRFFSMFGLVESGRKQINIPEAVYLVATVAICFLFSIFQVDIDIIIDINGAVLGFCFIYVLPSLLHIKCMYFPKGKRLLTGPLQLYLLNQENTHRSSTHSQVEKKSWPEELHQKVEIEMEGVSNKADIHQSLQGEIHHAHQGEMHHPHQGNINRADAAQQQITVEEAKKEERMLTVRLKDGQLITKFVNEATGAQTEVVELDYSYYYCKYEKPELKRQIIDMSLLSVMFLMGIFIMVNGLIQVVDMINGS